MLHKASKVRGFHLHASDGAIGHVDDFLFNDRWDVEYLLVDTSNWLGGRWVIVATSAVVAIDSPGKVISVDLTRAQIEGSPSIDGANVEAAENLPSFLIF
jgi:hypothetical protein